MAQFASEVVFIDAGKRFEDMNNVFFSTSVGYVFDLIFVCIYKENKEQIKGYIEEFDQICHYFSMRTKE